MKISENIINIGVSDNEQDLFEGQYHLEKGMSYNSYLIKDEKNLIIDTVDKRVTDKWLNNLEKTLGNETLDYLLISHMEPDHAYNIGLLANKYPEMKIVGNQITFNMLSNYFEDIDIKSRKVVVMEGDILDIGKHKLQFIMTPMVHWPEVMVTYDSKDKVLFSADGFGKFGALDIEEDWIDEARRYYTNIVGKYGAQVQALLKKATGLDIQTICPLHGPILKENLGYYLNLYQLWSTYTPEEDGIVIAFASIHGNKAFAARKFAHLLQDKGAKSVQVYDLSRSDMSLVVSQAFRYDKLVLMSSSYDAGIFPVMEDFLCHLRSKTYRNRKVGVVENGSWAPSAGKVMMSYLTAKDQAEEDMYLYSLGKTPAYQYDMPIAVFTETDLSSAKSLEEAGELENTVIVLSGDH